MHACVEVKNLKHTSEKTVSQYLYTIIVLWLHIGMCGGWLNSSCGYLHSAWTFPYKEYLVSLQVFTARPLMFVINDIPYTR